MPCFNCSIGINEKTLFYTLVYYYLYIYNINIVFTLYLILLFFYVSTYMVQVQMKHYMKHLNFWSFFLR